MRDRPHGADLLAVARRALLNDVAPALTGSPRYVALMVANAIGIASRELEEADRFEGAQRAVLARSSRNHEASTEAAIAELVNSVRTGRFDADVSLYEALTGSVEVAAAIWKPAKGG